MTILSNIPGRLRVHCPSLTRAAAGEQVRADLLAVNGVTGVTLNPRTGTLLVLYSTAAGGPEEILDVFRRLFGSVVDTAAASGCRPWSSPVAPLMASRALRKNAVNLGMLASLLASMAGIAARARTLHTAAGGLFLAALGVHLVEKRRSIIVTG